MPAPERFPLPDPEDRASEPAPPSSGVHEAATVAPPPSEKAPDDEEAELASFLRNTKSDREPISVENLYNEVPLYGKEEIPKPQEMTKSEEEREKKELQHAEAILSRLYNAMEADYDVMEDLLKGRGVEVPKHGLPLLLRGDLPQDAEVMTARGKLQKSLDAYVRTVDSLRNNGFNVRDVDEQLRDHATRK